MKKIFLVFILGILLLGTASAVIDKKFDKDIGKFGKVEFKERNIIDVFGWFSDKVEEIELKENTNYCIVNCEAIKEITLYKEGKLIDDIRYKTLDKIKDTSILSEKFYIKTGEKEKVVEDYTYECKKTGKIFTNGSAEEKCSNVKTGSHIEYEDIWKEYNFEKMKAGTYTLKLAGKKDAYQSVDWQIKSQGKWIEDWATWSSGMNNGLVSYYNFNETAGTKLVDVYNGTNNGTLSNMEVGDWSGTSLCFDGVDEFITILDDNSLDLENFTINLWVNMTTDFADNYPFDKRETGENGYYTNYMFLFDGAKPAFYAGNTGATGYGTAILSADNLVAGNWYMITFWKQGANAELFVSNVSKGTDATADVHINAGNFYIGRNGPNTQKFHGCIKLMGIWNRGLTANERYDLFADGGMYYVSIPPVTIGTIAMNLTSPENNAEITLKNITFNATIIPTSINITNVSLYVWNSSSVFNISINTTIPANTNITTNVSWIVPNFQIDDYTWNVYGCGKTDLGEYNCSWATANRSFSQGAVLNSITYNNITYETSTEQFNATFELPSGSAVTLMQLVYNGTNYSVTDYTETATTLTLSKSIDLPLNLNESQNETKSFFFRFTFGGGSVQETNTYNQTVAFIKLQQCNNTYTIQALNFTFYDEISQAVIASTGNYTSFESFFSYWLGNGNVVKNYSFQNLSSTNNNYRFCIFPYNQNITFKADTDIDFTADSYRENQYHLRNASLTNATNNIFLYLVRTDTATKFFFTFKQGVNFINDATINVQKYFTGLGMFKTVGILLTDDDGKTTMWQEVDANYKYSVVKNGEYLGAVERISSCSATPCTMTISLPSTDADLFESYYNQYATGILSNLSFNKTTKMVTYNFIDTTGLANYFRLEVKPIKLNESGVAVCDSTSYSVAGSLTCNLSSYTQDEFTATTYISRSPEKVDLVLGILISEDILEDLGLIGIFFIMGIIITIVFAAAVITKGSPSGVLWFLAAGILILKISGFFPFTWTVTIPLLVVIMYIISKVKT